MKRILPFLMFLCFFTQVKADHITGGEMYYVFNGISGGQYSYKVTLKLFTDCDSRRRVDLTCTVGIFNRFTGDRIRDVPVNMFSEEELNLTNQDPCITNPPVVCYRVSYFVFDVLLPGSQEGYILTSQVNYRVNSLANLYNGYSNIGASYSAEIPGISALAGAPANTSAMFTGSDLVVICSDHGFNYSFAAKDTDGDQLIYSFCDAQSTNAGGGGNIQYPSPPPFPTLPYGPLFSGSAPLGSKVQIDAATGLITGTAPAEGKYVVTVCVQELRNGVVIATQRKDIQIKIASCSIAEAAIKPEYMLCKDSKTISLENLSSSPLINAYQWDIMDASNTILLTSTNPAVNYTFAAAGTYRIKLHINPGQACSDSAVSMARVYPGFVPAFDYAGICANKPSKFRDLTTTVYGNVSSWIWDFGQPASAENTSLQQHPSHTYTGNGISDVRLIAGNDVGCIDTVYRQLSIVDKPPIALAFRDTLICVNDQLQLQAGGSGNFSWTPGAIINAGSGNPLVSPASTTTYYVALDDNGCKNSDSVRVRVVDHVTIAAMSDTTICQGDTIRLRIESDALKYAWTPALQLLDAGAKNPFVVTSSNTPYVVKASIGGCSATRTLNVATAPYPLAMAGKDTTVCYNTSAILRGSTNGTSVLWSPGDFLTSTISPVSVIAPKRTISYVLSAFDSRGGCPKPGRDTVTIYVRPQVHAFAGKDTSVIIGQPLNFQATGGARYLWLPGTSLSSTEIRNPVGMYNTTTPGIQYKVLVYDEYNCMDSAFVQVKVFSAVPSVFVPNAFTPNSDGVNDRLKPIPVGIKRIDYFYVYNRWGQLVYNSPDTENGWDGNVSGKQQAPAAYIWVVKAVDYNGNPYLKKGTCVLIR